jgi:hypothetical protein
VLQLFDSGPRLPELGCQSLVVAQQIAEARASHAQALLVRQDDEVFLAFPLYLWD